MTKIDVFIVKLCKEPDSIFYAFLEYHCTQAYYASVVDWFLMQKLTFFPNATGKFVRNSSGLYLKSNHCALFAQVRVKALGMRLGINLVFA